MIALMTILVFATVVVLVIGLATKSQQEKVLERVVERSQVAGMDSVEIESQRPFGERVVAPFLNRVSGIAMLLTPTGALQAIDEKLVTAGRPWGIGATEFLGLRVLSAGLFLLLGILVASWFHGSIVIKTVLLCLVTFAGLILPDSMLQHTIEARQLSIRRTLADTLDLLTVSVEAGLGLDGAMQKVVEKLRTPLALEMQQALQEMRLGKRRADALKDMAARVKVQELSTFVASINQGEKLGVAIGKVLKVQGDTLRVRRSQIAREFAAKLPVKMLFPLVFFIFPALFVVLVAPAAIRIARIFVHFPHH